MISNLVESDPTSQLEKKKEFDLKQTCDKNEEVIKIHDDYESCLLRMNGIDEIKLIDGKEYNNCQGYLMGFNTFA